ncbi:SpoIID/LytB domain-containing protein, partial [bacterium]|nr:SpoIID/LytB domain-containing protein [bacterium]
KADVLQVTLNAPAAMLEEKRYWYGVAHTQPTAEDWLNEARKIDPEAYLWLFGLTPAKSGVWQPWGWRLYATEKLENFFYKPPHGSPVLIAEEPVEFHSKIRHITPSISLSNGDKVVRTFTAGFVIQAEGSIQLIAAKVGKDYHWEHQETLDFGSRIWVDTGSDGMLCCGVDVELDDYVASVNSSEMPAESPLEYLKAQVVAARSWLLANWGTHHPDDPFVICNGDHCQCFYGGSRVKELSRRAVSQTCGDLLFNNDRVCDARYAKSCGGVTEPARNVWQFVDQPYLRNLRDLPDEPVMDLSREEDFIAFAKAGSDVLSCCAPRYADFSGENLGHAQQGYRWTRKLSGQELRDILSTKMGNDPGEIIDILPLRRGPSGRLIEIEIIGSKRRFKVSPELEIRRLLSRSHLPSSAFRIEKSGQGFLLSGMGWGHGVGLCQVGGVGLALKGWDYKQILRHYYPDTTVTRSY